ncbi:hypothetical protein [Ammoniphilus sp. CFH 90114]|uniref:hypothetical protein n=1 Tax=Ammoniphilus sp. CFH 90114 TaxID=2493665 RepID=UPI00100F0067|nr:hypothetical protein [Ammoniphilus sp. CFH 90114]RXT14664.1 hypothetical protein EIZ39_00145 [Ammoniphilus sp. CFH 90114]
MRISVNANGEILFRERMKVEAEHLLTRIKREKDPSERYLLCTTLLEIFEELDIDVASDSPIWQEMNMCYQDFFVS